MAKKYYNLASAKRFIQGRKTKHVVAVILYIVCRIQKTRHLLIDFSEILQANLYVLGSFYLKLVRVLQITVPIVDPSLFIKRYCAKLEFGDKTNLISSTALKFMQCMDRDWMTTGRRPSGLCGAAILISARFHGYKRSTKEITSVVHVCDETIRRRLEEFANTTTARLTKTEFEELTDSQDVSKGRDPPAFISNRKKEKYNELLGEKAKFIQKFLNDNESNTDNGWCNMSTRQNLDGQTDRNNQLNTIIADATANDAFTVNYTNDTVKTLITDRRSKINFHNSLKNSNLDVKIPEPTEDEPLSDIENDSELSTYFFTNEEYNLKRMLWDILFKDWIDEQKDKKKAIKKQNINRKKELKMSKIEVYSSINNPVNAIISSNKFRKMNVNVLSKMFENKKNIYNK